jgi:hypothetical protein
MAAVTLQSHQLQVEAAEVLRVAEKVTVAGWFEVDESALLHKQPTSYIAG